MKGLPKVKSFKKPNRIVMNKSNKEILRVSEINHQIASTLEASFTNLWVKGEISNFVAHSSGHWYFSLKEADSQIRGVMFRGYNQQLSFVPENGQEILVQGRITTYPPRGVYQINCATMEVAGAGELQKNFEALKQKLQMEGLFERERKKPLPLLPKHIGVITSSTGAAFQDILNILSRRFQGLKITLIPALVQGEHAPKSLISALKQAEQIKTLNVLIIGRGGGSQEDLWAFNNEELARMVAACPLPTISAVGHEIDFTICDFVADLRAPTPSAAAELVIKNRTDLIERLQKLQTQLSQSFSFHLTFFKEKIHSLQKQLPSPERLIQHFSQRLDDLSEQLKTAGRQALTNAKTQVDSHQKILLSLNPKQLMQRGFSIVTDSKGETLKTTKSLKRKDTILIEFFQGSASASIKKIH